MLALACLSACTPHTVGPARTYDDFERKARTTAEDSVSSVETVRLVADMFGAGDTFGTYASVAISEQEDVLTEVVGDFRSIQPPGPSSDRLRAALTVLLSQTLDDVAEVRLAVRRGDGHGAAAATAALGNDSEALQSFVDGLG